LFSLTISGILNFNLYNYLLSSDYQDKNNVSLERNFLKTLTKCISMKWPTFGKILCHHS